MTGFNSGGPVSARDNAAMSNPIRDCVHQNNGGVHSVFCSVGVKARSGVLVYADKQYCEAGHEVQ